MCGCVCARTLSLPLEIYSCGHMLAEVASSCFSLKAQIAIPSFRRKAGAQAGVQGTGTGTVVTAAAAAAAAAVAAAVCFPGPLGDVREGLVFLTAGSVPRRCCFPFLSSPPVHLS